MIAKKEHITCTGPFYLLINTFHYFFLSVFILLILNVNAHADERKVRVGVYANKPLVYQDENGEHKGLSIDVLRFAALKENWKLEFVPCSWSECLQMLKKGENDIQVIIAKTPERDKIYDFTSQSLYSLWAQIFIRPQADIESWTDLEGKNVAVHKDDLFSETFKKLIKEFGVECNLLEVGDYQSMLKLIKEHKADAGVFIQTFAEPYAIRGIVRRTPIMFNPVPIYYAFPKGKVPKLVTAIDRHLIMLKEDKDSIYYHSLEKIFGIEEGWAIPDWLKWALIVATSLMLLFLIVSMILKRQVKERTAELLLKTTGLEEEISARKITEEKLRESEEKYHQLFENESDAVMIFDAETIQFEDANKATLDLFGYSKEEFLALKVPDISAEKERTIRSVGGITENLPGSLHLPERQLIKKNGTIFLGEISAGHFTSKGRKKIVGAIRDISERKKAEEEMLLHSEIMNRMTEGTYLVRMDGIIVYTNPKFEQMFGYNPGEMIGRHASIVNYPTEKKPEERAREILDVLDKEGEWHGEIQNIRKDGTPFWCYASVVAFDHSKHGKVLVAVHNDITERKKAEEKIEQINESYDRLTDNANEAIFMVKVEGEGGRVVYLNPAAERIFGYTQADWDSDPAFGFKVIHPDYAEKHGQILKDLTASKKTIKNAILGWIAKDGRKVILEYTIIPIIDEKGEIIYFESIGRDITEYKKAEEELQKMHKLESTGILAGGIAHDFNNLLAAIRNNVYLSKTLVDRESSVYESMESTEKIIQRATNLTQQLLTFARGGAPVKKTAAIVELINESAEFVLKGSNVNCEYKGENDLCSVEIDEGQINQVIHNLILNACQSMPKGGTIRISTENSNLSSDAGLPLQEGKYVKIVIQDEGAGIAEEQLKNVFDPYFSTKEMGRGLGLSIVYSIIKNHNGHILVESEPGVGTTFTMYIPASDKKIEEKETVEDTFIAGEGKILLMDDEEIIRETAEQLLTHKGYTVECAKNGDEAIELYNKALETSQPFDAVILDLTVRGGMGGKEAIRKLLEIDPDVKAIVASGYSNDPVLANYKDYGFVGVFAKHDKTEELGKTLHKVING